MADRLGDSADQQQPHQCECRSRLRARTARDGWVVRSHLTPREREILVLIVDGLTSRQVATRLHRSERTVETHTANLYRKLGVGTRVQAVRKAAALGLVDLADGSRSATA